MTWEVIEQAKRMGKGAIVCISFQVRDLEKRESEWFRSGNEEQGGSYPI